MSRKRAHGESAAFFFALKMIRFVIFDIYLEHIVP